MDSTAKSITTAAIPSGQKSFIVIYRPAMNGYDDFLGRSVARSNLVVGSRRTL